MVLVAGLRHIVVASDALQRIVECFLAVAALISCVEIVSGRAAVVVVLRIGAVVGRAFSGSFESRIVVELGIDALLQFGDGHLEQPHLQHLLCRKALLLQLSLLLSLNEFLCHGCRVVIC